LLAEKLVVRGGHRHVPSGLKAFVDMLREMP
jgi:hypothetical protein